MARKKKEVPQVPEQAPHNPNWRFVRKTVSNPAFIPEVIQEKENPAATKRELRALLRDALDALGGAQWIVDFVYADDKNARAFLQVLGRTLPLELLGADKAPISVTIIAADGSSHKVELEPKVVPPELPFRLDS